MGAAASTVVVVTASSRLGFTSTRAVGRPVRALLRLCAARGGDWERRAGRGEVRALLEEREEGAGLRWRRSCSSVLEDVVRA